MPGFLLHAGAVVQCVHGGSAQSPSPVPKVTVSGQPIVLQPVPFVVAGCPFNVAGGPSPCVTAQWTTFSTKITSNGQALLLMDSQAVCTPNGTPLVIASTQTRVTGT